MSEDERAFEIKVYAVGLTDAEFEAMYIRVADAAHALDEQVITSGGEVHL
jgi:hypothetical protein